MHIASKKANFDVVYLLIEKNADLNIQNNVILKKTFNYLFDKDTSAIINKNKKFSFLFFKYFNFNNCYFI
jgi:hypothetical protein